MQVVIFSSPQRKAMLDSMLQELKGYDVYVIDNPETFGIDKFWMRWETARLYCLKSRHNDFIILPDDVTKFEFKEIKKIFNRYKNQLFTCNLIDDGRGKCWGSEQYFDCGGLTNRKTLQKIKVHPVSQDWINTRTSSGVGYQLTLQLRKIRATMITPAYSLCYHGDHESIMHPEERKKTPLISKMKLKRVAAIATYANRDIKSTIKSLMGQVDVIRIYDNEQRDVNLTDNGKFYFLQEYSEPVYYFTCDDDIIYPPTYIDDMIEAIERTKGIVTHHGRILSGGFNANYYRGHKAFRCLGNVYTECVIHVPGSGVTGWRTDYFNPTELYKDKRLRMSDILLGIEAAKQEKKITLLRHKAGYILENPAPIETQIFHNEVNNNQSKQIEGCNELLLALGFRP
jgi:hypothetical protein